MSDWGLVSIYYDYEHEYRQGKTANIQGLISKAYKYPGVDGMILHAYNGIKYLWDRIHDDYCRDFNLSTHLENIHNGVLVPGRWHELNTAMDTFFDREMIAPGADSVSFVLENWAEKRDYYNEEYNLQNDLFNCEGTFGWFYIKCTGNQRDGYKLSYGYTYYGEPDSARNLYDESRKLLLEPHKLESAEDDIPEDIKRALDFFDKEASLMASEDEFNAFEEEAADYLRKCLNSQL